MDRIQQPDTSGIEVQYADVWLPQDVYAPLQRVLQSAAENYGEVDPSILNMDETRVKQLSGVLGNAAFDKKDGYNISLTNFDMIAFEAVCIYAEEFFGDLGGAEKLQMSPPDITALTEKLVKYRLVAFPV